MELDVSENSDRVQSLSRISVAYIPQSLALLAVSMPKEDQIILATYATRLFLPFQIVRLILPSLQFQPFEKNTEKFGRVVGSDSTPEELNALGFPAKYLNAGVVVQPMYFYMGHISRHVRPGSTAVKGLVDSGAGRTFRPIGQHFAGGGVNDLARNGIELTVWPCEGSTRQVFKLNKHGQLEVSGHDWLGKPTKSCIGKSMDPSFKGLLLGTCNRTLDEAGLYESISVANDTVDYVNIRIKNGPKRHECLAIQKLKNGGGAYGLRGGSQVVLGNCSDSSVRDCRRLCYSQCSIDDT